MRPAFATRLIQSFGQAHPVETDEGVSDLPADMHRSSMLNMRDGEKYGFLMPRELFIDGVPELLLLRLLGLREMYGYELINEIRIRSNEVFTFGEGCIYPILHRLVAQKHLSARKELVNGRPRRYYKLTSKGEKRLSKLESSWQNISSSVINFGAEGSYFAS